MSSTSKNNPSSLIESLANRIRDAARIILAEELTEKLTEKLTGKLKVELRNPPSETPPLFQKPEAKNQEATLASQIDHTLLKPNATHDEIRKVCDDAKTYGFATVCVNSTHIRRAAELLEGSSVKPIAVVGFPLGAASIAAKAFEATEAIALGAMEIDMVLNIGALMSRDYATVLEDIQQVVQASRPYPVKVILETAMLNDEQKIIACGLSKAAGAAFVKTSTGFGPGGATVEDIALMRRVVGPEMGVKASGGIRTREDALRMLAAGATRIGASSSVAIVTSEPSNHSAGEKPGSY